MSDIVTSAAGAADLLGVDEVKVSQLSCGSWALYVRIGDVWWARTLRDSPTDNAVRIGREAFELAREARRQVRLFAAKVVEEFEGLRFSDEPGPDRLRTRFDAIAEEMSL